MNDLPTNKITLGLWNRSLCCFEQRYHLEVEAPNLFSALGVNDAGTTVEYLNFRELTEFLKKLVVARYEPCDEADFWEDYRREAHIAEAEINNDSEDNYD